MGDAAPIDRLRLRHDLLPAPQGMVRSGGGGAATQDAAQPSRQGRRDRLGAGAAGLGERRRPGGEKTGPNLTDKGKNGSKRHLVVGGKDVPLAVRHTAANVHDSKAFEEAVEVVAPICRLRGRSRKRPKKLQADKSYHYPRC